MRVTIVNGCAYWTCPVCKQPQVEADMIPYKYESFVLCGEPVEELTCGDCRADQLETRLSGEQGW
jgi:hypothetical protein